MDTGSGRSDSGLTCSQSDHGVVNSRYLIYEAQQAHYYGLPENLALASVTSEPAKALGLEHRIGFVKAGWDAGEQTLQRQRAITRK